VNSFSAPFIECVYIAVGDLPAKSVTVWIKPSWFANQWSANYLLVCTHGPQIFGLQNTHWTVRRILVTWSVSPKVPPTHQPSHWPHAGAAGRLATAGGSVRWTVRIQAGRGMWSIITWQWTS